MAEAAPPLNQLQLVKDEDKKYQVVFVGGKIFFYFLLADLIYHFSH